MAGSAGPVKGGETFCSNNRRMRDLFDVKALLIIALIFIPLEMILPLRGGQKLLRKHWLNDTIYFFLNGLVVKIGLLALVALAIGAIGVLVPHTVTVAVQSQAIWLQVAEVLLVADTGFYFAHRTFHKIPFLWKFHAVHHSIEEMDWLAAHRVHPVDQILTKGASYLPVFALGFSSTAIVIFALIYKWQALVIHSNSRIGLGPLKWLFASPHFHHWHHANEPAALDKNFAGQLPLLDLIGGTFFLPAHMPAQYGTNDPVPALYPDQMMYPFRAMMAAPLSPMAAPSGDVPA
jgi:sterol desaturase/sphingolipid hydroxylase (fatty acid hydroxylase superfamily)